MPGMPGISLPPRLAFQLLSRFAPVTEDLLMLHSCLKNVGRMLSETYREWDRHDDMRMAAALAFYSILLSSPI